MPIEETPRQKKQASYPVSCDSIAEKSVKLSCITSCSLACCTPVGLRPTASTRSTPASTRHSRRTPCPTMPVAPKTITFISISPVPSGAYSGGGRELIERYTGEGCGSIPQPCRRDGVLRSCRDLRRHRPPLELVESVRAVIAARRRL